MAALKELLTTDVGLMSLGVILFIIGMGLYLWRMVVRKMNESEKSG